MLNCISNIYLYIRCWLLIPNLIMYFFLNINHHGPQTYIRDILNILLSHFPEYL